MLATADILSAKASIERYGVDGWMRLTGAEPSECLHDALLVIEGTINELEHEHELHRATNAGRRAR